MQSTIITVIVPRLPPAIDGVGDYAIALAKQLRQDFQIETQFIVGDPSWSGDREISGFPIHQVKTRSMTDLLKLFDNIGSVSRNILVNYVPHGYAKRACPEWLIRGLELWKRDHESVTLTTMFHELYVTDGVPWKSDFWLSPIQKQLAVRLARLSDHCLTSCPIYVDKLEAFRQSAQRSVTLLSIPSNVGEPIDRPLLKDRDRTLLIFGQTVSKRRAYESADKLRLACEKLGIQEVLDIGPSTGLDVASLMGNIKIRELGEQSVVQIQELLLRSKAGFLSYPPTHLAKSGVFAAYCSHGLLPINDQSQELPGNNLVANEHYWCPEPCIEMSEARSQRIAQAASEWYYKHNWSIQAITFAKLMQNLS
jgi:hypothetical protein